MSNRLTVKTAYANIYSEPKFSSQLVTQALFFESLEIISEHDNWLKIVQWDGYSGYVHRFYLSEEPSQITQSVTVLDRLLPLCSEPSADSLAMVVPFGSEISTLDNEDGWCRTTSIDDREFFFKADRDRDIKNTRETIIALSDSLMGSPYLWGGKTPFGYDCSGFVQSVYRASGIEIKRDTSLQIKDQRMSSTDLSSSGKGDLIFFNIDGNGIDHVGILYNQDTVIHCGGEVKLQSLNDETHKRLRDCIVDIKSIGDIIDE